VDASPPGLHFIFSGRVAATGANKVPEEQASGQNIVLEVPVSDTVQPAIGARFVGVCVPAEKATQPGAAASRLKRKCTKRMRYLNTIGYGTAELRE
jgi:hypothetical protein